MDRVDWFFYESGLDTAETRARTEAARPGGMDPAHVMAKMGADAVRVELSSPKENPAGLAVHYSLGIMPGMLYGAMRDRVDYVGAGRGLGFGAAMFVLEDEIANPLLGTAAPPGRYPWTAHARGLESRLGRQPGQASARSCVSSRRPRRSCRGSRLAGPQALGEGFCGSVKRWEGSDDPARLLLGSRPERNVAGSME